MRLSSELWVFSKNAKSRAADKVHPSQTERTQMPINRRMEKVVVYLHDHILNNSENEWVKLRAITWINPSCIMLKEKKRVLWGYVWDDQMKWARN